MANPNSNKKNYAFVQVPLKLIPILDNNCFKVFSVIQHFKSLNGGNDPKIALQVLKRYCNMSYPTIIASLKALQANNIISVDSAMVQYDVETRSFNSAANTYIINDEKIMEYDRLTYAEIDQMEQISSTDYNYKQELKKKEHKPKKSDLIRQYIDISKTAVDNCDFINNLGIEVSLPTVNTVLREMRKEYSYTKPERKQSDNNEVVKELLKKVNDLEEKVSTLSKQEEVTITKPIVEKPFVVKEENAVDYGISILFKKDCMQLNDLELLKEIEYREDHKINSYCPKSILQFRKKEGIAPIPQESIMGVA